MRPDFCSFDGPAVNHVIASAVMYITEQAVDTLPVGTVGLMLFKGPKRAERKAARNHHRQTDDHIRG
jgi:hypothetical protein